MNWYIGQDIVAIVDHTQGDFKRGDEFKIKGLRLGFCKCDNVLIDVGNKTTDEYIGCGDCEVAGKSNGALWYDEICFAPLDPIKEAISELMERTQVTEI